LNSVIKLSTDPHFSLIALFKGEPAAGCTPPPFATGAKFYQYKE